jgi:GT2 family glycosyltransferase
MARPAVWAVIVHFGDPDVTDRCLHRLAAAEIPIDVVVVDNDGQFEGRPGIAVIRPPANLGFAGGANLGARHAMAHGASHVWFINNDAEPAPETIVRLLETATEASPDSLVGSLEQDPRDADSQGPWVNRAPMLPSSMRGRVRAVRGRLNAVDFLSGFSLLVSASAIERIGLFDESFFHYFEDVDYTIRACLAGAEVVLDCGAPMIHRRATTLGRGSPTETYYFFRNRLLLAARYRRVSPVAALFLCDPRHGIAPLFSRRKIRARDWPWLRSAWTGTLDAIRGRTGRMPA